MSKKNKTNETGTEKKTWERRGHWRTLPNGEKVYVKKATCTRHDESEPQAQTHAQSDCNHSEAPTIDEILVNNGANAQSGILNLDGRYAIKFKMRTLRNGEYLPKAFLPEYQTGRQVLEASGETDMAERFNTSFELYVNKVLSSFICAAVAKYRGLGNKAAETYDSYAPKTFISRAGRRVIVVRDIHIVYASNVVGAAALYAFKPNRNNGEAKWNNKAKLSIRLDNSEMTRMLCNIAKDIVIMSNVNVPANA